MIDSVGQVLHDLGNTIDLIATAIDSSPNTGYAILVTNITRRAEAASCFSPVPEKEAERVR